MCIRDSDSSARFDHWLTADPSNRLWNGLGVVPAPGELALFPGLLPPLLALAALLLVRPVREALPLAPARAPRRGLLVFLDIVSVVAGVVALLATSPSGLVIRHEGALVFSATRPARASAVFALALLVRWTLAWPTALPFRGRNLLDSFRRTRRPESLLVGLVFAGLGFLGSFGMHLPFHAALWGLLPPFRSIRVPARWAMMADLGLALLAGLGALALARAAAARWPARRRLPAAFFAATAALVLFEQRAAPLRLERGAADPDDVTAFLKRAPMRGGIVDLRSWPIWKFASRASQPSSKQRSRSRRRTLPRRSWFARSRAWAPSRPRLSSANSPSSASLTTAASAPWSASPQ